MGEITGPMAGELPDGRGVCGTRSFGFGLDPRLGKCNPFVREIPDEVGVGVASAAGGRGDASCVGLQFDVSDIRVDPGPLGDDPRSPALRRFLWDLESPLRTLIGVSRVTVPGGY